MGLLSHSEILKLHAAAISARLMESRFALLAGIDAGFVAGLPREANASDQILRDLDALNAVEALADGSVPLAVWLANAATRTSALKESAVFNVALERAAGPTRPQLHSVIVTRLDGRTTPTENRLLTQERPRPVLPQNLRNQFLSALLDVPKIASRNRRDELLSNLPPNIVDGLNRDDTARTDWTLVIGQLDRLGRLTSTGERPLIVVAQAALPYVEGTEAGRKLTDVINALEQYHGQGEPDARVIATPAPPPTTVDTKIPEAIIFGDERVSYDFVARALEASTSVARLIVPRFLGGAWRSPGLGTAWVIAPGLVITNHHVIEARLKDEAAATDDECRAQAAKSVAWFDYRVEGGARDELAIAELVCLNARLDYAVLRLEDGAGRRPLQIAKEPPRLMRGDRLNIVQHPRGGPLKYAIRSNHYVGPADPPKEHFLRYLTDTEGGASGSPVFDDTWKVIAMHHAAMPAPKQEHRGQVTYLNNEGIAIHAILDDLPARVRAEIAAAQGWSSDVAHA
jgi:hypothetical protein